MPRVLQSISKIFKAWLDSEKVDVEVPYSENLGHTLFNEEVQKISAKKELNAMFELLKMDKVRDR